MRTTPDNPPGMASLLCLASVTAVLAAALLAPRPAMGDEVEAVAVFSRASPEYLRTRGSEKGQHRETFAFGKGGIWMGEEGGTSEMRDFMDVARAIAPHLGERGFVPSRDPLETRLLIMVYWGTTHTVGPTGQSVAGEALQEATASVLAANVASQSVHFSPNDSCAPTQLQGGSQVNQAVRTPAEIDQENAMTGALAVESAEETQRLSLDLRNASMLGYDSLLKETSGREGTAMEIRRDDILDELEGRRYFVVLMAYDFQAMRTERRPVLLWETRYSMREKGDGLRDRISMMTAAAAPFFGKDSGGLVHKEAPYGHVDVGPIREVEASRQAPEGDSRQASSP